MSVWKGVYIFLKLKLTCMHAVVKSYASQNMKVFFKIEILLTLLPPCGQNRYYPVKNLPVRIQTFCWSFLFLIMNLTIL